MNYYEKYDQKIIVKAILEYLKTEDTGSSLFVEKCLVCHPPGEKLLLEKHNRVEWERIVKDRQQYARKATPQVIIGHDEAKLIVELLVKTQGEKME